MTSCPKRRMVLEFSDLEINVFYHLLFTWWKILIFHCVRFKAACEKKKRFRNLHHLYNTLMPLMYVYTSPAHLRLHTSPVLWESPIFISKFKRLHIFVVPLYIVLWHLEVFKKTCVDVFIFNMFNKNKTEAEQFSNTIINIDINMEKSTFYV